MFYDDIKEAMPKVDFWCYSKYGKHYTEDIRSEVILVALEKKDFEDRGVKFSSWLIEVAKNICQSAGSYISYRRINETDIIKERTCCQPCFYDERFYLQLIEEMPEHMKAALKMSMEGYKVREISKRMNLKQTTVKSRIWLARKTFKNKLMKAQGEI